METFFVEFNAGSLELSGIVTTSNYCRMFRVEMVTNEKDPIILNRSLKGDWMVIERGQRTLADKDFHELERAIDKWLSEFYSAKRMLVLTDFSEAADNAARYAAQLSRQLKTREIVLYHSFESILMPATTGFAPVGPGFTESAAGSLEKITKLKENLAEIVLPDTQISTRNDDRTLVPAVDMLVEQLRTGMVVVGMTGKSKLEQVFIGSHTLDLAKNCPAPLLAVPSGAVFQKIEKVVFACDLKNVLELTPLLAIKTFVNALGASLLILNIEHRTGDFDPDELVQLSALHEVWDDQDPEYHFINHEHVAEGIVAFATEKAAQLVITIPRVYGFFEGFFHQRITNQLASRIHVPLMLFRG
ncbi:universal stress protein [Pedobacter gandavensis]|uniref:universal stress protein n=1 Tax=Pedobacter gandavensis TaxID=2679963 RepID=UPI0029303360|nr:universal stress protein [Pedobacter gandavensis]